MVENPKRSFIERVRDRLAERKVEGEQGSLILDILIGMAIFALLAIIAVSAIGQYRARAYAQSAVSDAQSLGTAMEASITDGNGTVTVAQGASPSNVVTITSGGSGTTQTVNLSNGGKNVIKVPASNALPTAANQYTFSFCVIHDGQEWARYDSSKGGVVGSGRKAPTSTECPA